MRMCVCALRIFFSRIAKKSLTRANSRCRLSVSAGKCLAHPHHRKEGENEKIYTVLGYFGRND